VKIRRDTSTLLLPGFLELVPTEAGLERIQIRSEITVGEASRILNCSRTTIYALIDDGTLPARRLRDVPRSKLLIHGPAVVARRAAG
jgi:excisionase family DNA binding protein